MTWLQDIRRRGFSVGLQVLAACMVVYFGYHAIQGERGFLSYVRLSQQLDEAKAARAELRTEREAMEAKVAGLRLDSLDTDLLEERARIMLNFGRAREAEIVLPASD